MIFPNLTLRKCEYNFKFRDKKYQSDKVYYMKILYYLEKYRRREIIEGIPIVKREKSLFVA
ncbi:MAG: hypothetical protein FXF49_07445 [Flexistipes sinusarabici]|uniref:Uncharacterized protein n=1 Tax=Flexistipes sinusarabici TaxID=2352 RepID=A0A5D0MMQ1_FLESI|nr:MAG: hypothetical protein FXF49_07445 [Flexistipes sinusarabici]